MSNSTLATNTMQENKSSPSKNKSEISSQSLMKNQSILHNNNCSNNNSNNNSNNKYKKQRNLLPHSQTIPNLGKI